MLAIQQLRSDGTIASSAPVMGQWTPTIPDISEIIPGASSNASNGEAAAAQPSPPQQPTTSTTPTTQPKKWYEDWRVWAGIGGGVLVLGIGGWLVLR